MADKPITILCVHGLGDHRTSDWHIKWEEAIKGAFPQILILALDIRFVTYDDIFEKTEITPLETAGSAVEACQEWGGVPLEPRDRGIVSDISEKIKWTAGLRASPGSRTTASRPQSRKRVLDVVRAEANRTSHSRP